MHLLFIFCQDYFPLSCIYTGLYPTATSFLVEGLAMQNTLAMLNIPQNMALA